MNEDSPGKKDGGGYDVVLMHGATEDGQGAQVLRARPGRLETGEVRPMPEGRPMVPGAEVVRLERRKDAPAFFDVHVECKVPENAAAAASRAAGGPPQIATQAYRESWARTFGPRRDALN